MMVDEGEWMQRRAKKEDVYGRMSTYHHPPETVQQTGLLHHAVSDLCSVHDTFGVCHLRQTLYY